MGSIIINTRIRGPRGEAVLRALVDTGFYGDIITLPENIRDLGIEFKHEKIRRLPNGEVIKVRYGGGEIEVEGSITYGDIEIYPGLKLPQGIDAILGATAIEKMGFRIDPKAGKLEKVELYLL